MNDASIPGSRQEPGKVLSRGEATRLLRETPPGGIAGGSELFEAVYGELRGLASAYMRRERPDHTLQATALVHEAYLRLFDAAEAGWQDRAHFFALAARLMRQILIEHARGRAAIKRGGNRLRITLEPGVAAAPDADAFEVIAVDEILSALSKLSDRRARIVELRVFGGLTIEEIARAMDMPLKTVEADWYMARAWMRVELKDQGFAIDEPC